MSSASCERRAQTESAIYKDVRFSRYNKGNFSSIWWIAKESGPEIPDWRVLLSNGTELYMPEVKESAIKEMIEAEFGETAFAHISQLTTGTVWYGFTTWNWLEFKDGALISFSLSSGGDPPLSKVSVGRGKNGNLYPLGMTKQELRDAFGEPVRFAHGSYYVH